MKCVVDLAREKLPIAKDYPNNRIIVYVTVEGILKERYYPNGTVSEILDDMLYSVEFRRVRVKNGWDWEFSYCNEIPTKINL